MAGRGTNGTKALEAARVRFTLHEYTHDPRHSSYGTEAADALGIPPSRVGGISPVGQRKRLPVVIDSSACSFPTVFCSAGRRGLEIELAPDDLVAVTSATLATIVAP